MMEKKGVGAEPSSVQRIVIIRHGERLDNVDYTWTETAARPYDPPLTEKGAEQARNAGKQLLGKVWADKQRKRYIIRVPN